MSITETERVMQGRIAIDKSERIRRPTSGPSVNPPQALPPPKLNEKGQLAEEEVASRRSGSGVASEIVLGDIRSGDEEGCIYASYAVLTQTGYHPDRK
jgi:hypothetical protein